MKKAICLILALLFILPSLVACKEDDKDNTSKSSISGDISGNSTVEFPNEKMDFQNTDITICTPSTGRHIYGELQFVPMEESSSQAINDAVSERINIMKSQYGINIKIESEKYPTDRLESIISGGITDFPIFVDSVDRMCTATAAGYFRPVDNLQYLDLSNDWWDQRTNEYLTLSSHKYLISGDALLTDDDNVYMTLFNKDMYQNTGLSETYGDIYTYVTDGKFTYDNYLAMSKVVAVPDPNGEWSLDATYGNVSNTYVATVMMNGAGLTLAEKTDSALRITVGDEATITNFTKVFEIMSDTSTIVAEFFQPDHFGKMFNIFANGKGLFFSTTTSSISTLKKMDEEDIVKFGILPIPKASETQETYYNCANIYHTSVMGIPNNITGTLLDTTAYALEALGYYGKYATKSLTEAYYMTTLKLQALTDDRDAEMLDAVLNSRIFDLGAIFNWGNVLSLYTSSITKHQNSLTSDYQAIKDAAQAAMEQTILDLAKLDTLYE